MTTEDHYKYLRRRIARCGCADSLYVIWAYSQFIQFRGFQFPDDIEKPSEFQASSRTSCLIHEWELQIVAEEVILHAQPQPSGEVKTFRDWSTLSSIVQRLRDLENEIYGDNKNADVLVEMSRIMHRQFPWQQARPNTKQVYRYYRVFSDPKAAAICQKVLGVSIDDLYVLVLTAHSHFTKAAALNLENSPPTIKPLLAFAARPFAQMKDLIAKAHRLDHSYAYRLGPLWQFPLILVENTNSKLAICPIPTLLFWRLTTGLYYDLITADQDFGNALGASFERYVGEVLTEAITSSQLCFFAEAKYGSRSQPKATPDWLIIEGDVAAAFVECKAKRMTIAAKAAMGDLSPLEADIGKLANAVLQLYERMIEYDSGQFPNLKYVATRKCYPVVVTLEHWYISGRTSELLRDAVARLMMDAGVDLDWLDKAPYSIMSADEFESAAQIINEVGVLACFSGKFANTEMRSWMFREYMSEQFEAEWKARPFLFRDKMAALIDRLIEVAKIQLSP